jgi:hypothetical protein
MSERIPKSDIERAGGLYGLQPVDISNWQKKEPFFREKAEAFICKNYPTILLSVLMLSGSLAVGVGMVRGGEIDANTVDSNPNLPKPVHVGPYIAKRFEYNPPITSAANSIFEARIAKK